MKKQTKKLVLSAEAIRVLDKDLANVVGGRPRTPLDTCPPVTNLCGSHAQREQHAGDPAAPCTARAAVRRRARR